MVRNLPLVCLYFIKTVTIKHLIVSLRAPATVISNVRTGVFWWRDVYNKAVFEKSNGQLAEFHRARTRSISAEICPNQRASVLEYINAHTIHLKGPES
jgi:hypothetical protein